VIEGDEISSFYDPMIAKLIVWDETRELAIARMERALNDYRIGGLKTNLGFLGKLVSAQPFKDIEIDTGFIEKHHDLLFSKKDKTDDHALIQASLACVLSTQALTSCAPVQQHDPYSPWAATNAWRLNESATHLVELVDEFNNEHHINVVQSGSSYLFNLQQQQYIVDAQLTDDHLVTTINGHKTSLLVDITEHQVSLFLKQGIEHFTRKVHDGSDFEAHDDGDKLTAPMNGTIVEVSSKAGDTVKAGDVLVIMEAMKMEYAISAPHDGVVTEVFFATGDMVKDGQLLVELSELED